MVGESGSRSRRGSVEVGEEKPRQQKPELPVLLFKVIATEQMMPTDLTFLSVYPLEAEWVLPPGAVLEARRELKDSVDAMVEGGHCTKVECTTVELAPRLPRKWK